MLYLCPLCRRTSRPGVPSVRVVVSRRPKRYAAREYAHRPARSHHKSAKESQHDPGGVGWEVDRELTVCPDCAPR